MPFPNKEVSFLDINLAKDLITVVLVFLPPILFFTKCYLEDKGNIILLIAIFLLYLVSIPFTQNLAPFIIVVFNILYIKKSEDCSYAFLNGDKDIFDFNHKNFDIGQALFYAFASYTAAMLFSAIVVLVMKQTSVPIKNQEILDMLQNSDMVSFLVTVPVAVIFAPVVEEFVFRYVIFEKILKNKVGIPIAIIISSLIFGIIHFNLKAFIPITFIGVVNCYLIHKKGYWYAVFNHFIFNLIPIVAMFAMKIGKIPF